jgi:hypothetical protein
VGDEGSVERRNLLGASAEFWTLDVKTGANANPDMDRAEENGNIAFHTDLDMH